jgi:hypothetical protein
MVEPEGSTAVTLNHADGNELGPVTSTSHPQFQNNPVHISYPST